MTGPLNAPTILTMPLGCQQGKFTPTGLLKESSGPGRHAGPSMWEQGSLIFRGRPALAMRGGGCCAVRAGFLSSASSLKDTSPFPMLSITLLMTFLGPTPLRRFAFRSVRVRSWQSHRQVLPARTVTWRRFRLVSRRSRVLPLPSMWRGGACQVCHLQTTCCMP